MDIRPLTTLVPAVQFRALADIDRIFFEASSVQTFESPAQRRAFHWLWLGRYLIEEPGAAHIARAGGAGGHVMGYVVGALTDPAANDAALGLDYFGVFAAQTARFPAHLHINVASTARSRGIGERLIAAFERHAVRNGAPGVHVVTGAGMRNVDFYHRLGFREVARTPRGAGHVVMLAKELRPR